eukprot:TRINITY_DN10510_c0_g3_i1.p1 TRINITY_DN10510_c0_g3~~TRINITY_DN10510_c0_g3_i1.p1  ORF type:complete len:560 (-),score=79.09 TRINITY_DN10510_c0_g3_i1:97-1776(-)
MASASDSEEEDVWRRPQLARAAPDDTKVQVGMSAGTRRNVSPIGRLGTNESGFASFERLPPPPQEERPQLRTGLDPIGFSLDSQHLRDVLLNGKCNHCSNRTGLPSCDHTDAQKTPATPRAHAHAHAHAHATPRTRSLALTAPMATTTQRPASCVAPCAPAPALASGANTPAMPWGPLISGGQQRSMTPMRRVVTTACSASAPVGTSPVVSTAQAPSVLVAAAPVRHAVPQVVAPPVAQITRRVSYVPTASAAVPVTSPTGCSLACSAAAPATAPAWLSGARTPRSLDVSSLSGYATPTVSSVSLSAGALGYYTSDVIKRARSVGSVSTAAPLINSVAASAAQSHASPAAISGTWRPSAPGTPRSGHLAAAMTSCGTPSAFAWDDASSIDAHNTSAQWAHAPLSARSLTAVSSRSNLGYGYSPQVPLSAVVGRRSASPIRVTTTVERRTSAGHSAASAPGSYVLRSQAAQQSLAATPLVPAPSSASADGRAVLMVRPLSPDRVRDLGSQAPMPGAAEMATNFAWAAAATAATYADAVDSFEEANHSQYVEPVAYASYSA